MCTISGIVTDAPDSERLNDVLWMLSSTRHRGPDSCGVWSDSERAVVHAPDPEALADAAPTAPGRILLAQSRLAIVGSARARQPFTSPDGRLALAHNGEIYNHDELRSILPDGGRSATTGSDSEVLMRLIEAHDDGDVVEAVRRVVRLATGMYALAVTDGETLVLARDPVGKKPLYYVDGPFFAFASERKALVRVATHAGAAVKTLLPGHVLHVRPGEAPVVEEVETLPVGPIDIVDYDEAVAGYEAALNVSIERRTRGFTKAAVLFSGGVDSVLVARLLQNAGLEVTGYTMGMEGSGDVEASEEVARELGIPLKVARVDAEALERELPAIVHAAELGGPLQVEVSIPMWFASKMAHEDGHRVIFTGQAADELFAGYDWYRNVVRENGHLTLHARLWEDILMLPVDTLEREDRITMAHSLELRAPFLDTDLVRFSMRVAPQLKCRDPDDLMRKHVHREVALRCGVPASVALREKSAAQDGAGTHTLLELLARRRFPDGLEGEAPEAFADFGSNYRYRDTMGAYAPPEVHALLDAVVREHGLSVADASGEFPAPVVTRRIAVKPAPVVITPTAATRGSRPPL